MAGLPRIFDEIGWTVTPSIPENFRMLCPKACQVQKPRFTTWKIPLDFD